MEHQYGDGDVLNKTKKSIAFIRRRKKPNYFSRVLHFLQNVLQETLEWSCL